MQIVPHRPSGGRQIGRILAALGAAARWLEFLRDLGLLDWLGELIAELFQD